MSYLFVFIWLGSLLPEQYQQTITDCNTRLQNNCVLLNDSYWEYYLEKYKDLLGLRQDKLNSLAPVERSDILRLLYLYDKGGIYSDLDNDIDYDCLYDFLEGKPDFFFGEQQLKKGNLSPSNFFINSPKPQNPELKKLISSIKYCTYCPVLGLAGPTLIARQKAPFQIVKQCVKKHLYHGKWMNDSTYQLLITILGIFFSLLILTAILILKFKRLNDWCSKSNQKTQFEVQEVSQSV